MKRLHPPWIKTKASRNVAKRARLAAIIRRTAKPARLAAQATLLDSARKAR